MSYQRLAYEDQDSAHRMHDDCAACAGSIRLPAPRIPAQAVQSPAPSLRFDDQARELPKPVIEVSEAAAHLAARLHLHLD